MLPKPEQLIAQRTDRHSFVFIIPFAPFFPGIAAAPAGHQENAFAVSALQKRFILELSFQANRVQTHFLYVAKFRFAPRFVHSEHHVRRPASAANQNWFAIHFE
jgi:hypothetical protein